MSGFIKTTDGIDEILLERGSLKINIPNSTGTSFNSFYVLHNTDGVVISTNSTGTPGVKINSTTTSIDIL